MIREVFGVRLQEEPGNQFFRGLQIRSGRALLPEFQQNLPPTAGILQAQRMRRSCKRRRSDLFEHGNEGRKSR